MDQPLDFSKSSKLASEITRPLMMHLPPEMSSVYLDENYLKFREEMLKKKTQDKSRRVSSFSPCSSISTSSVCNQDSSSNSPETSSNLNHISDTTTTNDTNSNPSSIESLTTPTQSSRKKGKPLPDSAKDEAYWERRRKNNEAAKRSRDARRLKENEIGIRAAYLEQENLKLKSEVAMLRKENQRLKYVLVQNLNGQTAIW